MAESFFLIRKLLFLLFWCVNSIVYLNSYLSIQTASGAFLFSGMFYGTWSQLISLINCYVFFGHIVTAKLLWMFWKKNSPNFRLKLIQVLWYLKIYSIVPNFFFSKNIRQFDQYPYIQRKFKSVLLLLG